MLRVRVDANAPDSWHLLRHRDLFEEHGISLQGDGGAGPDLIVADYNRCLTSRQLGFTSDVHSRYSFSRESWDRVNDLAREGLPFILCLRLPTAERVGLNRLPHLAAASPALLGTIQNRELRRGAGDRPTLRGVTHFHEIHVDYLRLRAAGEVPPDPELEREVQEYLGDPLYAAPDFLPAARARQCIWDLQRSFMSDHCQPFRAASLSLTGPRDIDVFCSMDYGPGKQPGNADPMSDRRLYTWHRRLALRRIASLGRRCRVKCGRKVSTGQAYFRDMVDAKICVSPWGFGAYCIRDFEAVLAGAVLVKPDTSFVSSHPDLFGPGGHYVTCRSDFADLEETVGRILADYEQLGPMRERARRLVLDAWNPAEVVRRFCQTVRELHELRGQPAQASLS